MLDTTFSRLVGGVYDAVVEPDLWTEALDRIRREFDFHIAMMGVMKLPSNEIVVNVACNVPATFEAAIHRYGKHIEALWGGLQHFTIEEPVLQSPFLPPKWQENPYYIEWCKPQGLIDQVVVVLANDRTSNATLGMGIHENRGPMTPETMDDLRLLIPHLCRAVKISRLLDMTTNAAVR